MRPDIEHTPDIEQHARWVYGKHPTDELLKSWIKNGQMYALVDGENIAGLVAITMYQEEEYEAIDWATELANNEVAVLHLLAVCPECQGKGVGTAILNESLRLALHKGKRSLRLSNLVRVKQYPFATIKLDMEIVWDYFNNRDTLLPTIVKGFRDMGLSITAEGIESEEMAQVLAGIGTTYLQGFYFSKPLPSKEFVEKYALREWQVQR